MNENTYFKLFDQYLGKSKLVPELYKQVKKDFPNLTEASRFSYNNASSDSIDDDEYDYKDKKLIDKYCDKNNINYLKQDILCNAFKTVSDCLQYKNRYGLVKKSDINKSKIIQSYKTFFLCIIIEQSSLPDTGNWVRINRYAKPRFWAMLMVYIITYIIKPISYLLILFENKRLPIKGEPFDFREYEDTWFGYYDSYSGDALPKEMISNPKLADKIYNKLVKKHERNLESPTAEKLNQEWLQEFKKKR